ncbi:hypothetical protein WJX72_000138 [[Myrmecia] bisecta]|uniref:VWFD domain-containing protein n=1 Tax=[Myrmecia] bisecta TaxID=41462 RepID=A0AAW1R4A1_9CHLO
MAKITKAVLLALLGTILFAQAIQAGRGRDNDDCWNENDCDSCFSCQPRQNWFGRRLLNFQSNRCCTRTRGSGCGDPLMTGYDGRTFQFEGQAGHIYNLFTEQNHQLNVKMVEADLHDEAHAETGGTFMDTLSFQYKDTIVVAEVDAEGNMTVTMNGKVIPDKYYKELYDNEALVESEANFPGVGHLIVVTTPMIVVHIQSVKPYTDEFNQLNRGHIDFATTLLEKPREMHGVIGQTMFNKAKHPLLDMQFHGEGVDADYEVSTISGTDFKFNLFGKVLELPGHGRMALENEKLATPIIMGRFSNARLPVIRF